MAEMKALYHQWLSSYTFEQKQFSSLAVWCEIVLTQAFKASAGCPSPNPLRTAVCCMVLDKISTIFGSFETVIKTIILEVTVPSCISLSPG